MELFITENYSNYISRGVVQILHCTTSNFQSLRFLNTLSLSSTYWGTEWKYYFRYTCCSYWLWGWGIHITYGVQPLNLWAGNLSSLK